MAEEVSPPPDQLEVDKWGRPLGPDGKPVASPPRPPKETNTCCCFLIIFVIVIAAIAGLVAILIVTGAIGPEPPEETKKS
ncbi:unnamed protein product, partial [Mesorhabditis spiculigera]